MHLSFTFNEVEDWTGTDIFVTWKNSYYCSAVHFFGLSNPPHGLEQLIFSFL